MATTSTTPAPSAPLQPRWRTALIFLLPLLALAAIIALFVWTSGAGLNVAPVAPTETLQFEQTILRRGEIELHLRNTSPQEITLAQVNINDAIWPYTVTPDATIPRLSSATVTPSLLKRRRLHGLDSRRGGDARAHRSDLLELHAHRRLCWHHPDPAGDVLAPGAAAAGVTRDALPDGRDGGAAHLSRR